MYVEKGRIVERPITEVELRQFEHRPPGNFQDRIFIMRLISAYRELRHYRSTACIHEQHGNCRFNCKFCEKQCSCDCHTKLEREAPRKPTYQEMEQQLTDARKEVERLRE